MTVPTAHSLTVGALLRRHRKAAGLTQEDLTGAAALSVSTLSDKYQAATAICERLGEWLHRPQIERVPSRLSVATIVTTWITVVGPERFLLPYRVGAGLLRFFRLDLG